MREATVTHLSTTPIKGLGLNHPAEVSLGPKGAAGDRDFFLVDDKDKLVSITRTGSLVTLFAEHDAVARSLRLHCADGRHWEGEVVLGGAVHAHFWADHRVAGHLVEGQWNEVLSSFVNFTVRLVRADVPGDGSDVRPVTLLGAASVAELVRQAGVAAVDARRFRMLIEFSGCGAHAEDGWAGRTLEVGDAVLRVGGRVPRCAGTTRDPASGARDQPVVRMIKAYRGLQPTELGRGVPFGVYADVLRGGAVRVGDRLRLAA
ncbi:MAG: domain containing protein [Solirubrobacterales bacterium]|nr:domain containing protein [Solirubrobacterales bacterium]